MTSRVRSADYILPMAFIYAFLLVFWLALGIRFETYPLYAFLHFLDPELLRTRLLESCWYLHIQPPLFNFFCGLVLKTGAASAPILFHALFIVMGFLAYVAIFLLMIRLSVRPGSALVFSTLFVASPAFVLFGHWLFYTLPCLLLLTLSAVCFHASVDHGSRRAIAGFFFCLLTLAGMWSTFHFIHYVLLFLALLVICARHRRRVLIFGMIPLLIILGWNFKNYTLFGFFGTSSLLGKNLFINTAGNMNGIERERLVAQGVLSPISLISRWNTVDIFPPEYQHADGFENVAALRQISKSHGPHNFNHLAHIKISQQYMEDSLAAVRCSPKSFALAMAVAWYHYFRPASDYTCSTENSARLATIKWLDDHILSGRMPDSFIDRFHLARATGSPPFLFLLAGIPVLFLTGLMTALRGTNGKVQLTRAQRWTLVYMGFNIAYIAILGTALDFAETYRYRFTTDPFFLAVLALFVQARFTARAE